MNELIKANWYQQSTGCLIACLVGSSDDRYMSAKCTFMGTSEIVPHVTAPAEQPRSRLTEGQDEVVRQQVETAKEAARKQVGAIGRDDDWARKQPRKRTGVAKYGFECLPVAHDGKNWRDECDKLHLDSSVTEDTAEQPAAKVRRFRNKETGIVVRVFGDGHGTYESGPFQGSLTAARLAHFVGDKGYEEIIEQTAAEPSGVIPNPQPSPKHLQEASEEAIKEFGRLRNISFGVLRELAHKILAPAERELAAIKQADDDRSTTIQMLEADNDRLSGQNASMKTAIAKLQECGEFAKRSWPVEARDIAACHAAAAADTVSEPNPNALTQEKYDALAVKLAQSIQENAKAQADAEKLARIIKRIGQYATAKINDWADVRAQFRIIREAVDSAQPTQGSGPVTENSLPQSRSHDGGVAPDLPQHRQCLQCGYHAVDYLLESATYFCKVCDLRGQARDFKTERDEARAESATLHQEKIALEQKISNYWMWQGDGSDHLASLTCPILIDAAKLRDIIDRREAKAQANRIRELETELATLRDDLSAACGPSRYGNLEVVEDNGRWCVKDGIRWIADFYGSKHNAAAFVAAENARAKHATKGKELLEEVERLRNWKELTNAMLDHMGVPKNCLPGGHPKYHYHPRLTWLADHIAKLSQRPVNGAAVIAAVDRVMSISGSPKFTDADKVYKIRTILRSALASVPARCPTCDSPEKKLHPAVQFEGEVEICKDKWHLANVPSETGGET
jgi:hypothetical protein